MVLLRRLALNRTAVVGALGKHLSIAATAFQHRSVDRRCQFLRLLAHGVELLKKLGKLREVGVG